MNGLDRRIAELIMGEPEPGVPPSNMHERTENWRSEWTYDSYYDPTYRWIPKPFSTSLEEALRALHEVLGDDPQLLMEYYRSKQTSELVWMAYWGLYGYGQTLPEAICNLLLALKERGEK